MNEIEPLSEVFSDVVGFGTIRIGNVSSYYSKSYGKKTFYLLKLSVHCQYLHFEQLNLVIKIVIDILYQCTSRSNC